MALGVLVAVPTIASADTNDAHQGYVAEGRDHRGDGRFERERMERERQERERVERERMERERRERVERERVERERAEHQRACWYAYQNGAQTWQLAQMGCYGS